MHGAILPHMSCLSARQLVLLFCTLTFVVHPSAAQGISPNDYPFQVESYPQLLKLFDYKHDAPVNAKLNPLVSKGTIQVSEVQYDDPLGGDPFAGYLVTSSTRSPQPAVVFIHSEGRNDFLPEAIFLTRLGAITMPLDTIVRKSYPEQMRHTVVGLRRAFDYLASRPDVDPHRICLVGHSFGAMMSAVVAGVDDRFKCFVLEGGELGMTFHYRGTIGPDRKVRENLSPDELMKAMADIAPYDAIHYAGHIKAATLFQSGRLDVGVSEMEATYFYEAASGPKQIKWYDTGHNMGYDPAVLKDRAEFLQKQLGLNPPMPLLCAELGLGKGCRK
jgi:hypothetical protein